MNFFAPTVFSSSSLPETSETVHSKKCLTPSLAMPCYIPRQGGNRDTEGTVCGFFLCDLGKEYELFLRMQRTKCLNGPQIRIH